MDNATVSPLFSDSELKLFCSSLPNMRRYIEFGAGNSTRFMVSQPHIERITSVETDKAFIANLLADTSIQDAILREKLNIVHANIGNTGAYGYPMPGADPKLLMNYTLHLWPNLNRDYDSVLIDGRYRLSTALLGLMYLPCAYFYFHDFLNRPQYLPLLKYIDIIDYADTLISFIRRPNINDIVILDEIQKHILDPR